MRPKCRLRRSTSPAALEGLIEPWKQQPTINGIQQLTHASKDIQPQSPIAIADWAVSDGLISYPQAMSFMNDRAAAIRKGEAPELVWLLQHPPLYTAGTSAKPDDLLDATRFPVFSAGRGGQLTYHGPGQRIAYVMLDLRRTGGDIRSFIGNLERWVIGALSDFNVRGEVRPGRVGVWVKAAGGDAEDKIAAIGLRVSRGVSTHGISLNVDPDLRHYGGIVPCGISEHGVTSLAALGLPVTMADADVALRRHFEAQFGPVRRVPPPVSDAA